MTKQQEIDAWQRFAAAMPPTSTYSGAWIHDQIPYLTDAIRSDLAPETRAATMADAAAALATAHADAAEVLRLIAADAAALMAAAQADATQTRAEAVAWAEKTLAGPAAALRAALRQIEQ